MDQAVLPKATGPRVWKFYLARATFSDLIFRLFEALPSAVLGSSALER